MSVKNEGFLHLEFSMISSLNDSYRTIISVYGCDPFKEYFDDALKALEEFEQAELITVGDEKIEVSQTGTMLIRNICMPFDAYLNNIPEDKRRFSKTIWF